MARIESRIFDCSLALHYAGSVALYMAIVSVGAAIRAVGKARETREAVACIAADVPR